jgi:glucose-1-phosphate thymidylyltransferase
VRLARSRRLGEVDESSEIIGRQVKVTPATGVPKAHRLVLADHSEVQIIS